jgi:hypothetical protein
MLLAELGIIPQRIHSQLAAVRLLTEKGFG